MTYKDWVTWLETRNPMPLIRPGLEKTRSALVDAGILDLIDSKKVVLIAGTNGKGTTAKTLEQLLLAAGQNVGLYTSPHLTETTERIRIGGKEISQNAFASLCSHYRPIIEKWDLTHFEALTLFAADYFFKQKKVDWSIFEVGLGGTWDATNVIPHDYSIVTALGFDHMHILGKTLEEIAINKFGIIQKNNTVFHSAFPPDIQPVLQNRLKDTRSTEIEIPAAQYEIKKASPVSEYILKTDWGSAKLALPGARAAQNMLLALTVFKELGFDPRKYLNVLSQIQWPARMTQLNAPSPCPIYLSGDHNLQGIESLVEILQHSSFEKLFIILGVSKNRTPMEFLPAFARLKNVEITLTKPAFQGVTPMVPPGMQFYENPIEALSAMTKKAQSKDLIVITGSLYLCGDYLKGTRI